MFSTLSTSAGERRRRSAALIFGVVSQSALIGLIALFAMLFPDELSVVRTHFVVTWLPELTPVPKPETPPPPPPPQKLVAPPRQLVLPKIKPPEVAEIPKPPPIQLPKPKLEPLPAVPKPQPAPATVVMNTFNQKTEGPKPIQQAAVRATGFGDPSLPPTTKRPADQVQTGGFGSPAGLPGTAQRGAVGNVPKLGSFGLPEGPGYGNGTGGSSGVRGVIANAGFGSGGAGGSGTGGGSGSSGGGGAPVSLGGFAKPVAAPRPQAVQAPEPTEFQPVEIIFKPAPVYTEEAKRLGIEGEVTLSVVFQASGTIRVMSVVKSLGHGLDQAAEQAATQIRFRPARRSGQPQDFPATLRIQFRLGGQAS